MIAVGKLVAVFGVVFESQMVRFLQQRIDDLDATLLEMLMQPETDIGDIRRERHATEVVAQGTQLVIRRRPRADIEAEDRGLVEQGDAIRGDAELRSQELQEFQFSAVISCQR